MPSPLYEQFQPQNPLISMAQQFKQNPLGMLAQRYKFPQNMSNPNDILQYLLNTHQVSQQQVNQIVIIEEGQVASAACLSLYLRR